MLDQHKTVPKGHSDFTFKYEHKQYVQSVSKVCSPNNFGAVDRLEHSFL